MANDLDRAKAAAARRAVAPITADASVALGTGSTAAFAIRELARRFPDGGRLTLVASSAASEGLAKELGLPVRALGASDQFDWMIDGADEVSDRLDLTKGGGGALFREKLLARLSKRLVIVVDETKLVTALGMRRPVPIEIVPFARPYVTSEVGRLGFSAAWRRQTPGGPPFVTDNQLEILDLTPRRPLEDPWRTETELRAIAGVVETGLFVGMADRVYVGHRDGRVEERTRSEGGRSPGST